MTTPTPENGSAPEDLLARRPIGLESTPVAAAAPRGKPSLTIVLGGVVAAAVLFAGGLLVGHATGTSAAAATGRGGAAGFAGGNRVPGATGRPGGTGAGGGFTAGKIASINGSSITLTAADGSTVTVTTTGSTTVSKTAASDLSALAVGDTITVIGQKSGTSVAAQAISEGAGAFGGFGGGARTPVPAATS
jgi:Domain of unknown function (DUF5666)